MPDQSIGGGQDGTVQASGTHCAVHDARDTYAFDMSILILVHSERLYQCEPMGRGGTGGGFTPGPGGVSETSPPRLSSGDVVHCAVVAALSAITGQGISEVAYRHCRVVPPKKSTS